MRWETHLDEEEYDGSENFLSSDGKHPGETKNEGTGSSDHSLEAGVEESDNDDSSDDAPESDENRIKSSDGGIDIVHTELQISKDVAGNERETDELVRAFRSR